MFENAALHDNALFVGLPPETVDEVTRGLTRIALRAGDILFREGDPGAAMYLVISGVVQIYAPRESGDVTISTASAGSYFGELALLGLEHRSASARALEHATLLAIDAPAFARLTEQHPSIIANIGRTLVQHLVSTTRSMVTSEQGELVLVAVTGIPLHQPFISYIGDAVAALSGFPVAVIAPHRALASWTSLASVVRANVSPEHTNDTHPSWFGYRAGSLLAGDSIEAAIDAVSNYFRRTWKRTVVFIGSEDEASFPAMLRSADRAFVIGPPNAIVVWAGGSAVSGERRGTPVEAVPMVAGHRQQGSVIQQLERAGYARPTMFLPPLEALDRQVLDPFRAAHLTERAPDRQTGALRLARALAKARIGIALGSGGARGNAHIGVFRFLEERGIPFDAVSGTSMGAMVGGFFADGRDSASGSAAMEHWMRTGYRKLMRPVLSTRSILSGRVIESACRELFDELEFEELPTPFAVVAADLVTGRGIVLRSGRLVPAVHASMSIPGLFPPVIHGPHVLVDGGVCDPVPVEALGELRADIRIVSNISYSPEDLERWMAEEGQSAQKRSIQEGKVPNVVDTYFAAFGIAVAEKAAMSETVADVYIRPRFINTSWREFSLGPEHQQRGYTAASEAESQLRGALPWAFQPS